MRRHRRQGLTLQGLGLGRIGRVAMVPDTPQTWGMIAKVRHLIGFVDEASFEEHRLVRPQGIDEAADIKLMRELVFDRRKIDLGRFSQKQMRGKTPDFKLFKDLTLRGYCELKSPRDNWIFNFPSDLKPGEHRVQLRTDPTARNLAEHVIEAAKQFDTVNPDHALPNMMILVSHARRRGPADLHMALTGIQVPGGHPLFLLVDKEKGWEKQKELWDAARSIDLFFWIDAHKRTCQHICPIGALRLTEACDLLGLKIPERSA